MIKSFREVLTEATEQEVTTKNGKLVPKDRKELMKLVNDKNIHLGDIDTSKITDMSWLFYGSYRYDFSGIEKWDVSNVTNMNKMFWKCTSFNQSLNNWNVSKVTDMKDMFSGCSSFNQPLNKWNVSNVTNMSGMFQGCSYFNQPLDKWDVSKVAIMYSMFRECKRFNSDLSRWDVSNVIDMEYMFYGCEEFNCYTLSNWKPKSI